MSKMIKFSKEAKMLVEKGVNVLVDAVKVTLGPRGRNVIINTGYTPVITNDGVTIAKAVELEEQFENIGASIVKEVAIRTNDVAGDGTTTATVLAGAMIKEAMRYINNGANPIEIKKGIDMTTEIAVNEIKKMSSKINGKEDMELVANISANDNNIGKLVANAVERVGTEGVITVEESKTMTTELEIVEGYKLERGYLSSYMVTDAEKMEAVLSDPYILITDKKISAIQELLPILEQIVDTGKKLFLVAEDIESEVLSTLVVNKLRGVFTCVAVKAPSFGNRKKEILKDICCITGATFVSEELGKNIKEVKVEDLGSAGQVKITKDTSVIINGKGDKEEIEGRIWNIKREIEKEEEEYEKEQLKERFSKISGGVAVIKVGAVTELEMKEKKMRIEDALSATIAASEEGVVAGGGTIYLDIIPEIKKIYERLDGDRKLGAGVVIKALEKPAAQIADNSGKDGNVILNKVKEMGKGIGYDVLTDSFIDMKRNGIIDPTKVSRTALENAASISGMIITTEVVISENIEDGKKQYSSNEMHGE